jgi:hypothetical protein
MNDPLRSGERSELLEALPLYGAQSTAGKKTKSGKNIRELDTIVP